MRVLRMTTRSLMLIIAFFAVLIGGAIEGMKLAVDLKEEMRARQGVVDEIDNSLKQANIWINNLERRLAKSKQQATLDPRHDHWTKDLAHRRTSADRLARVKPKYERLAYYPWEAFPDSKNDFYERYYLTGSELYHFNRYLDHRAYVIWSFSGAAVAVSLILVSALLIGLIARRLIHFRSDRTPSSASFATDRG
jgi:hypothetical protein